MNTIAEAKQPGSNREMNELTVQVKKLTNEIKAMPPYTGSNTFQNTAVAFFEFYENKYQQTVKPIKPNTAADAEIIDKDEISMAEKKLIASLLVQEQIFTDKNHFVIQINTLHQPHTDYLN